MDSKWKQFSKRNDMVYRIFKSSTLSQIVFQLTDMVNIFEEKLTEKEFIHRFQTLNPDVEADPSIIEVVAKELSSAEIIQTQEEEETTVNLEFFECDILLKWEFKLQKLPPEKMHEIITKNLLAVTNYLAFTKVLVYTSISNLTRKYVRFFLIFQEKLIDTIRAKEKEIIQLYENGASLINASLKTEPFDRNHLVHDSDMVTNDILFITTDPFHQLMEEQAVCSKRTRGEVTHLKLDDDKLISNSKQSEESTSKDKDSNPGGTNRFYVPKRKIDDISKSKTTRKLQKL